MLGYVSYVEPSSVSSFVPGLLLLHSFHSAILDSNPSISVFFFVLVVLFFSCIFFSSSSSIVLFFAVLSFFLVSLFFLTKTRLLCILKDEMNSVKFLTKWSFAPYSSHCDQYYFISLFRHRLFWLFNITKKSECVMRKNEIQFQAECLFSLCLVLNPFETSCSIYLLLSSDFDSSWLQDHKIQYFSRKKRSPICLLSIMYFLFVRFSFSYSRRFLFFSSGLFVITYPST